MGWLSRLINLIQETIGSTRRAPDAAETGVFVLSTWYATLKAILPGVLGALLLSGLAFARSGFARIVCAVGGVALIGVGISVWRGLRRVTVAGGIVVVEGADGSRSSWPLERLYIPNAGSQMSRSGGPIAVIDRASGKTVFRIPRDLPGWEVLVARIPSVD